MSAPCGGCPPCCTQCVFTPNPRPLPAQHAIIATKQEYGCVRPDGGAVVMAEGLLGMVRGESFHPVTGEGAEFLYATGNRFSKYC